MKRLLFRKINLRLAIIALGVSAFVSSCLHFATPTSGEYSNDTALLTQIKPSDKVISLFLQPDSFVYAYEKDDVRNHKKLALNELPGYLKASANTPPLFIVIKHTPRVPYNLMVSVLNDLTIPQVRYYTMVRANAEEVKYIEDLQ